jgi:hypothetical protein
VDHEIQACGGAVGEVGEADVVSGHEEEWREEIRAV